MNKEEAIKQLKKHKQEIDKQYISSRYSKAIEVALNLIQKQEKIIDKMAEYFEGYEINDVIIFENKEQVKEFFKKEAEKDENADNH